MFDDAEYHQTARQRKTLLDLFSNLDSIAKRVKNLPGTSNELKLHVNIVRDTSEYVQRNMQTLQMMPRVTRPDDAEIQVISMDEVRTDAEVGMLESQYGQVDAFLRVAIKERRIDDAEVLKGNLAEIAGLILGVREGRNC